MTSTTSLAPNIELVREVLSEAGPLKPGELQTLLRARDVALADRLIQSLPDRHPDVFAIDPAGKLALTSQIADPEDEPPEEHRRLWWFEEVAVEPIDRDKVVVLDIETTGLDPEIDEIWQIAVHNLGTSGPITWEVACDAHDQGAIRRNTVSLRGALQELQSILDSAEAIAGHRVGAFDLPFLERAAVRAGLSWHVDLPVLDLHRLSVLADPTATSRTLVELAHAYDIELSKPHLADHDTAATAAIINHLVDVVYDADDPSWALVWRCLVEGGDPWAQVLSPGTPVSVLERALEPADDPLTRGVVAGGPPSASSAVQAGFDALRASSPDHRERPSQLELSRAIAAALDQGANVAAEAPTGTGKSLAYLIPAAGRAGGSHQPVVVATHTKVLQRQLRDDAQRLRDLGLLDAPFRQIQGVSNYVCTRNVAQAIEGHEASGSEWFAIAVGVRALASSPNGVWGDVTDYLLTRDDLAYSLQRAALATTTNGCERQSCDQVNRCPLHRRLPGKGEPVGIVSVNHAVVASWVKVREKGHKAPGDLFGDHPTAIVFDEAHNLEDSLTTAWTDSTGAQDLHTQLAVAWGRHGPIRRAAADLGKDHPSLSGLKGMRKPLDDAIDRLGVAAATYLHEYGRDQQIALMPPMRSRPEFRALKGAAHEVGGGLQRLIAALEDLLGRNQDDDAGAGRQVGTATRKLIAAAIADLGERSETLWHLTQLDDPQAFVHLLAAQPDDADDLGNSWVYQRVPIEIGPRFATSIVSQAHATVLTSATLTVNQSFDFLASRLRLDLDGEENPGAFRTLQVGSPFDHARQSAVVLTSHLPVLSPANEREFCEELAADQVGFLSLTGGRELALFAARARMLQVVQLVKSRERELGERGVEILVQGEQSPREISTRFRGSPGAVLYGLRSYWEGFDAPGDTLSYLVIEKPPYPHLNDAVYAARVRALEERGTDAFAAYTVPRTAITLAQGFGRLVRTESDRGVAIICDRRMQQPRPHNAVLLGTLPTPNVLYARDRDDAWVTSISFVTGSEPDLSDALEMPVNAQVALLEELRLLPGEDPTQKLRRAAAELFGIDELRPEQLEVMSSLLAGQDVLGFMPTGFGKSLCFQLPALLHPEQRPTIVVSPLVALIKDQVDDLRGQHGLRGVTGITGRTSVAERTEVLRDLSDGKIRILYVSPERLVRDPNLRGALKQQVLGALIVDEAHCISSWGHDFRPEFRQISKAVLEFRRSPRLGLTATATPEVAEDIETTLDMDSPLTMRVPVDRSDLRYWVRRVSKDQDRTRELLRFITHHGDRPGIIYASRRALTEELAWIIRQTGVTARAYHAALDPNQRESIQDDYLAGTTQIIVATKAFGMGVNKPDVAWVVHYDLPESLEAYAQEAGRAARDPNISGDCVLLYTKGDIARRRRQVRKQSVTEDVQLAHRLVVAISRGARRGPDHLVEPDDLANELGIETDQLNVATAWLERLGNLERLTDASTRGHITIGVREPTDQSEKHRFVKLLKHELKCRVGVQRRIDLGEVANEHGLDADELETLLIEWSLQRLVTFQVTRREWRIKIVDPHVDDVAFAQLVTKWRQVEERRLESMISYAGAETCRRSIIAHQFGDDYVDCSTSGGLNCDICDGGQPVWHDVPLQQVCDPEQLVDVNLVTLQAIAWASRYTGGRYGEVSLRAALCGKESLGEGRPISQGLLSCPQFGALRYLRSNERKLDIAVSTLLDQEAIMRDAVARGDSSYQSLAVTERGLAMLGGSP